MLARFCNKLFFIHRGAVHLTLNGKKHTVAQGGTFMVPRGNLYGLENAAQRETEIFFAQGREHQSDDEEDEEGETVADGSRTPTRRRSSTVTTSGPNRGAGSGVGAGLVNSRVFGSGSGRVSASENKRAGTASATASPNKARSMGHIR